MGVVARCVMPLHRWPNRRVSWESFHTSWLVRLADHLNDERLPEGFVARPTEHILGVGPDVLTLRNRRPAGPGNHVATLPQADVHLEFEPRETPQFVGVYSQYDETKLVAVVELVSPGNKSRPAAVDAFASKCELLLSDGVHLVIVDLLTAPRDNLHNPIMARVQGPPHDLCPSVPYSVGYRVIQDEDGASRKVTVDAWVRPMPVGEPLPAVPLFVHPDEFVEIDLEKVYEVTIRLGRYVVADTG